MTMQLYRCLYLFVFLYCNAIRFVNRAQFDKCKRCRLFMHVCHYCNITFGVLLAAWMLLVKWMCACVSWMLLVKWMCACVSLECQSEGNKALGFICGSILK